MKPHLPSVKFLLCVGLCLAASGCLTSVQPSSDELKPLKITYIRIGEEQYNFVGQLALTYTGTIAIPFCLNNNNTADLMIQQGGEIYQEKASDHSLRVVKKWDSGPTFFPVYSIIDGRMLNHHVYWNETADGQGSVQYTIHIWNQILNPEPIHRQDRWFNMTFVPYQSGTSYTEGRLNGGNCLADWEISRE